MRFHLFLLCLFSLWWVHPLSFLCDRWHLFTRGQLSKGTLQLHRLWGGLSIVTRRPLTAKWGLPTVWKHGICHVHPQGSAPRCVQYGCGGENDGLSPLQPSVLGWETWGYCYPSVTMQRESLTENKTTASREKKGSRKGCSSNWHCLSQWIQGYQKLNYIFLLQRHPPNEENTVHTRKEGKSPEGGLQSAAGPQILVCSDIRITGWQELLRLRVPKTKSR